MHKILIANRGEIAVRIIRACREMDLSTVAVFSDCDRTALHVRLADEAYAIGASPPRDSYLRIDRLIEAARAAGADAVHPGYGFLAENEDFAAAVRDAGLTFIGPSAAAVALMGSKTAARGAAMRAGVPVVPGTETPLAPDVSDAEIARHWQRRRLSAARQGGRRRRRQGHAHGHRPGRARRRRARGAIGGRRRVRRRRGLSRAPADAAAAHRSPAARRPARHGAAVCRARVLDPAPAPEGRRGDAVAGRDARRSPGDDRGGRRRGAIGGLHQRRHDRVPARRGRPLLLPRDEHAAAGRASDHRDGHRHRPGAVADSHRPRRAARPRSGAAGDAVGPRHRVPHLRRGSRQQLPAVARPHPAAAGARRARASATTAARRPVSTCRSSTTR